MLLVDPAPLVVGGFTVHQEALGSLPSETLVGLWRFVVSMEVGVRRQPVIVVVAAHGSRAPAANDAHQRVVDALATMVDLPVASAYLELAEPSIPDAIDAAIASGAATVLVLPYFLHPGRHLTDDLPQIVQDASGRHPAAAVELLASFGSEPGLLEILVAQVNAAVPNS